MSVNKSHKHFAYINLQENNKMYTHPIDKQLNYMLHGNFSKGWAISEKLQQETPDDSRHLFNRGWFLLNQGKFQEGYQSLEAGRYLNTYGSGHIGTQKPIWNPAEMDLEGKRVILALEGGYGDELINVRFATPLAELGATVIVRASEAIHCLVKRVEGVSEVVTPYQVRDVHHDCWIPGFSAGWLLGYDFTTLINTPYLTPHPLSVEIWKNVIKTDKLKVGIRWSGNPEFEHQQFRKFPVEPLLDLSKNKKVQLYSLQRDNDLRELPSDIGDLQHLLISWEDTAAAIANMDLVISSCTAIAHLAAAMGKPTWILVPILPYHTWAYQAPESRTSPWYGDNVRLFRQTKYESWDKSFSMLRKEFRALSAVPEEVVNLDDLIVKAGEQQSRTKRPSVTLPPTGKTTYSS